MMETLAIESLTAEEVRALDLRQQVDALSDCLHAGKELGRELITATSQLATARVAALRGPSDDTKSAVIMRKAILDTIALRARSLREMRSILQSLIRAASI